MRFNFNLIALFVAILLIFIATWSIINQIKETHLQNDPMLDNLKQKLRPFFDRKDFSGNLEPLNKKNILDEISLYKGKKSYTINKEKVFLCLKDEKGEYYLDQYLIFVLLHEICHVICKSVGHTTEFHEIFENLLVEAAQFGVYDPSIPMIKDYCEYASDD